MTVGEEEARLLVGVVSVVCVRGAPVSTTVCAVSRRRSDDVLCRLG